MSYYNTKKQVDRLLSQYNLKFIKKNKKYYLTGFTGNQVDLIGESFKNLSEYNDFLKINITNLKNKSMYLNKDQQVFEFLEFAKNKLDVNLNSRKDYFFLYSKDYDIKNNYSKRYTIFIHQYHSYISKGNYLINLNDLSLTQKGAIFSWEHVDYQIEKGYCNETIKELVDCINLFKLNKKLSSGLKEKEKNKTIKI